MNIDTILLLIAPSAAILGALVGGFLSIFGHHYTATRLWKNAHKDKKVDLIVNTHGAFLAECSRVALHEETLAKADCSKLYSLLGQIQIISDPNTYQKAKSMVKAAVFMAEARHPGDIASSNHASIASATEEFCSESRNEVERILAE